MEFVWKLRLADGAVFEEEVVVVVFVVVVEFSMSLLCLRNWCDGWQCVLNEK